MGVKERYNQRNGIDTTARNTSDNGYVGTAERYRRKIEEEQKRYQKAEAKAESKRKTEEKNKQKSPTKQNAVKHREAQRDNKPTKTTGDELINPWIVKKQSAESAPPMRNNTLSEAKQTAKKSPTPTESNRKTPTANEYLKKTALDKEQTAKEYQTMKHDTAIAQKMQEQGISKEEAEKQYADEFMREENRKQANRETLEYQRFGQEHPALGTAARMVSNLGSAAGLIEVGKAAFDKDYEVDPNSKYFAPQRITEALTSGVTENIDSDAGKFAYNIGTTIGDMLLTKFTTGPLGSLGYSASMAAQSAAGTAKEAADRGMSDGAIVGEAVASAAITAATSAFGFDKIFNPTSANTVKQLGLNLAKGFASEALEEGSEEALNIVLDSVIGELANENSAYREQYNQLVASGYSPEEAQKTTIANLVKQVGEAALIGGISGGVIAGANSTLQFFSTKANEVKNIANNLFANETQIETDTSWQNAQETAPNPSVTEQGDNLPAQTQNAPEGEISAQNNELDDVAFDEYDFYDSQTYAAELEREAAANDGFYFEDSDSAEWQEVEAHLNSLDSEKTHALSETIAQSRAVMADPNSTTEQRNTAQSNAIKAQYDAETYEGIKGEITERRESGLGLAADIMLDVHGTKVSADTQAERRIIDVAKKKFGRTVQFVDDIKGSNGHLKDGIIYISRNAESPTTVVFGHEFAHTLEATTEYRQLVSHMKINDPYLKSKMQEAGVDFDGLVKLKQDEYFASLGKELSEAEAEAELIAEAISEEFFSDYDVMLSLATQNRSVFQRLKQWFERNIVKTTTRTMSESKAAKQTRRLLLRAEQVAKKSTKSNAQLTKPKYSAKDAFASFGIKKINDYVHVQKSVIAQLEKEGFFGENGFIVVKNTDAGLDIEINKSGIIETLGKGDRYERLPNRIKQLKLASIRQLPEIIKNATVDSNSDNYHNPNSSVKYIYLSSVTEIDGKSYKVMLDIRQSPQKNKFHLHRIYDIKETEQVSGVVGNNPKLPYLTSRSEDILSDSAKNVKSSAKKSEAVKAIAEDYGFTDASAQNIVRVAASMRKSAGSTADINELSVNIASALTKAKNGTIDEADIDSITKLLADNATTRNDAFLDDVSPILNYLKNSKISISQSDIADLGNAFSDVRRRAFPYTNIAKEGGMPVDELYQDLSAEFPEYFNAEENTHPADQLNSIVDFIEYVKQKRTVGTYAEEDAYLNLRNEVAAVLTSSNENSSTYVNQLMELCKAYGELKNGVPKSTDGETRVRQTVASINGTASVQGNPQMQERFAKEVVSGRFNYEVQLQGKEAVSFVDSIKNAPDVAQAFETEYNRCRQALEKGNPSPQDVLYASALLPMAAEYLSADDFINYTSTIAEVGTRSGQIISALRYIGQMSGAQRLKAIERKVDDYNRKMSGKYADDKPGSGTFDENGEIQEDPDDLDPAVSVWIKTRNAKKFVPLEIPADLREQLVKAKTTNEADEIINKINEYLSTQIHYSFWDKLNAWRYFAMLSNPKTWIKNFAGNTVMLGVSRGKDIAAAAISKPAEYLTKKAVGKGYTYTNPQTVSVRKSSVAKQAAKTLMDNDKTIEQLFSGQNKWSGKSGMQLMQQNNALSNTPIVRNLVEVEEKGLNDQPFRLARAKSVLAQSIHINMKNGKIKDLDKFMRVALNQDTSDISNTEKIEYRRLYDAFCKAAAREGDESTFREENRLINDINKLKQNHKVAGALFEGAVPFLKTPANIVKRGVEYNPIGLISTLTKGTNDLKNGKIDANQYINNLAKGMSGSAVMALGAVLGSLGYLSAGNDDDEDEAKQKLENSQEYALNIGDYSFTLDWLTPASLSLFSGVKLAERVTEMMSEDSQLDWSDLLSCAEVILDIVKDTADPMFNLTMLDGLDGALKAISSTQFTDDSTGARFTALVEYCAENWFTQIAPSVTSALARTLDDTVRTYYTDKNSDIPAGMQSIWITAKKKIPGAIGTNPAYLDIWGQPKSSGNIGERAAENFALPFYIEKKTDDAATNAIQDFAEDNDIAYSDVMPKNAKDFTYKYNGETINLTQEEYEKMSAAIGAAQKEAVEKHLVRGVPVEIEYTYTAIKASNKSGRSTKKTTFKGNIATAKNINGWSESDDVEYSYKTDEASGSQSKKAVGVTAAPDEDFRAMLYDKMMKTVAEQAKDKALYEIVKERGTRSDAK